MKETQVASWRADTSWVLRKVSGLFDPKEHFLGCDKFILPGRNFSRSFELLLVELPMLPDLGSSLQLA